MIEVRCLRSSVRSGGQDFPIFMGFLPATQLAACAEAPSFDPQTAQSEIARNVLNPPIRDWQRPLDTGRVHRIQSFFGGSGEIMPNPVLLAVNPTDSTARVRLRPESGVNGAPMGTWIAEIEERRDASDPRPLWILDGQHRIAGLAASAQASNDVPFVLLINDEIPSYQPSMLAKLFAQVTTSATPLDPLHNEWLTYVFELGAYALQQPSHQDHRDGLKTVAILCEKQTLTSGEANPFFNGIRFNPSASAVHPAGGGFAYNCLELKEIIRQEYYSRLGASGRLSPEEVAEQLALSYLALQRTIRTPANRSVFFGDPAHGHKPMQDAYIAGILTHLRVRGSPSSWLDVLRLLRFHETNWDFSVWVNTMGGTAGTLSRNIALGTLRWTFGAAQLPPNNTSLSDYLQGNTARFLLDASFLTSTGRASTPGRIQSEVGPGVQSMSIGERRHLKLSDVSKNLGKVDVISSPFGWHFSTSDLRRGYVVDEASAPESITLDFRLHLYGGLAKEATLNVTWDPTSNP